MTFELHFGHNEEENKIINHSTNFVLFCAMIYTFVFNYKHKHI